MRDFITTSYLSLPTEFVLEDTLKAVHGFQNGKAFCFAISSETPVFDKIREAHKPLRQMMEDIEQRMLLDFLENDKDTPRMVLKIEHQEPNLRMVE